MATYNVKGPDGKLHEFQGPAGMPNDLVNLLANDYFHTEEAPAPPPAPKAETGFIPSVIRGGRGISSLLGDVAPAMAAKALGYDEYAKKQMQEAAAYQKETEEKYPSAIPSFSDIKGPGDALTYIVESVGEAIPSMLPSLFTGGAASIVGRGAVLAARSAAEKAAASSIAQGVTEVEAKNIAMQAGIQAAKSEALKYVATGAVVGSAAQNIPDVYQNLYEKGHDDLGTALAFGTFNSVLDAVTPLNLMRKAKLSGIPEEQIIGAWYKRAGRGAVEGMVSEGGTEALQEMSSAAAEKFVDENNNFFTPQNFERFINAGLKGGLGGAAITGTANVAFGRAAKEGETNPDADFVSNVAAETEKLMTQVYSDQAPTTIPELTSELTNIVSKEATPVETTPETIVEATPPLAPVKQLSEEQRIKKENDLKAAQDTLAAYQEKGVRGTFIKVTQNKIAKLQNELSITPQGAPDVTEPNAGAIGTSVPVVGTTTPTTSAPAGLTTTQRDGMVSIEPNVGESIEGKGTQPATVELPDPVKKAIQNHVDEGYTKRESMDALLESEIYEDDDGLFINSSPLINKTQQQVAEEYFDSIKPKQNKETVKYQEPPIDKNDSREKEKEFFQAFTKLEEEKQSLLTKDGRKPGTKSPNRVRWDAIDNEIADARYKWYNLKLKNDTQEINVGLDELTNLANELNVVNGVGKTYTKENIESQIDANSKNTSISKLDYIKQNIQSVKNKIAQFSKQEKPNGTQTSETIKTESQEQKAETAVEFNEDQRTLYDEEAEYYNENNPERKVPAYESLTNEQKTNYLPLIGNNTIEEHGNAVGVLADQIHGPAKAPEIKTTPVPQYTEAQLRRANASAFLNHVRTTSKNAWRRAVAQRLHEVGLKTKVEVVDSLPSGRKAEYDPKTDTTRLTKEAQDEETLLHELTHAGTVKIIKRYEDGEKLTEKQEKAAIHLEFLMDESKKELGAKFPDAYESLHEFVSYAINNEAFQNALGNLKIDPKFSIIPENTSLWTDMLRALADLLNIKALGLMRDGNMSTEAIAAFEDILSPPPTKGIAMEPLAVKQQPTVGKAPPLTEEQKAAQSDEEFVTEAEKSVELKERGGKVLLRKLFTKEGAHWLAERFQNDRYILKIKEDRAALVGKIDRLSEQLNNVYGQITRSTGIAVNEFNERLKFPTEDVHTAVKAYADKNKISVEAALARLHLILEARHEPERRLVKFLKEVPLDNTDKNIKVSDFIKTPELQKMFNGTEFSAAGFREEILDKILTQPMFDVADDTRKAYAQELRAAVDEIVFAKDGKYNAKVIEVVRPGGKTGLVETTPEMFDKNNNRYDVIGGRSAADIARITKLFDNAESSKEIQNVEDAVQKVHQITIDLNKEANYWSRPVANVVDFYGFKHYVPFKGRPGKRVIDEQFNFDSRSLGGEFQDGQDTMQGRLSESDNPILQSLADGATSALRAGKKDVTLAIKNSVLGEYKILRGRKVDTIKFEERYKGEVNKQRISGDDKIFHYNNDGSIDVIQITDEREKEAIRRTYRSNQPVIDLINRFTSGIGQMHTRYNPAFAPMNFVRDALTNAFIIGAELGPEKAGRLLTAISSEVASGGLYRSLNYSNLYSQGKFDEIARLAGGDKAYDDLNETERYYRDLQTFVKKGGRVSYLQGVAAKGALDELIKEVGRSGLLVKKEQIDKFIDIYNDMFELSSRVATYRMMKEDIFNSNKKDGMPEDRARKDAEIQAVEYAKNLANFEQVGQWGKSMGALYMFFRPAATGAVRAIEATAPLFSKFDEALFRTEESAKGVSAAAIDKAIKEKRQQQKSARAMAASLTGLGVGIYMMAMMMSGDDDQGRNKVASDDMARWTRYARFHIPGTDIILQMPWGFGLGTFASAGAQIASIFAGRNSTTDALSNIATTALDSYLPLPISKINMTDNFPAWALDSVAPSAVRPFFEYVMNIDGLGREIYNNRQSRYGDAYTGGDSIPELYKSAARSLFNVTNGAVDWSPNTMYFFANNYIDGMAKSLTGVSNLGLTLMGKKESDMRNDIPFFSSFLGSKSNLDAREFSNAENRIKEMDKRINALKDKPEMFREYIDSHAKDYYLVQYYNSAVNGSLRDLRAVANKIRTDKDMPILERKQRLDEIIKLQNMTKRNILNVFESISGSPSIYR